MRIRTLAIALLAAVAGVSQAQTTPPTTALHVEALIIDKGFVAPYDLELKHGVWIAEATTLEGRRVDVLADVPAGTITILDRTNNAVLSATQVRAALEQAGYRQITDLDFDDGFWEAEAVNSGSQRVELIIHPVSGAVLAERVEGQPPSNSSLLSASQIHTILTSAGYRNIRELKFDDGFWEADATNPAGLRVELKIDPRTGTVVREERD